RAIITNKFTVVQNPSDEILLYLKNKLAYEDKSIKYQLKRMEKNPFQRNSGYYKKLQKEVKGTLLKDLNGHAAFNSGLAYLVEGLMEIEDRRHDTGKKIS